MPRVNIPSIANGSRLFLSFRGPLLSIPNKQREWKKYKRESKYVGIINTRGLFTTLEYHRKDINFREFVQSDLAIQILADTRDSFYLAATEKKNRRAAGEASASKSGIQREFLLVVSFTYVAVGENEPFNERTAHSALRADFNETL